MINDQNDKDQMKRDLEKYKILPEDIHTFVFEREETQQSTVLDISVPTDDEYVDLYEIFEEHCPLKNYKVSMYDPE